MEYFEKSAIIRLEQMGLKVERTYVRKDNKNAAEGTECRDEEEKENENGEDYSVVTMYELEKLTSEAVALSDEDINVVTQSTSDADLIIPEDNKAVLSFDEILEGIVKCNKKNITVQLHTSKELFEDILNNSPE